MGGIGGFRLPKKWDDKWRNNYGLTHSNSPLYNGFIMNREPDMLQMRVQTMSIAETFAHDFNVIRRFLKLDALKGVLEKAGLALLRGLFWGGVYLAMAIWFVFNAFLWVAMLLTIRDGVQWFLGTNRRR